ncbi:MAG: hypothetical protein ACI36W_03770 [Coriobacteriales bacterium]
MDMRRLLHTALPYLLVALAFAALASVCMRGLPSELEGQALAAANQLLQGKGTLNPQWGSLQASAVLLQPALALSTALLGGTAGAVACMRLVFLTLAFLEALLSCKLLQGSLGETGSMLMSLGALLCCGCGLAIAAPYGLCVFFGYAAFLCALCSQQQRSEDDGSAGYARVLAPLGAGLFAMMAVVCNMVAATLMLILWVLPLCFDRSREVAVQMLWNAAGAVLGAAIFLLAATAGSDPLGQLQAVAAGLQAERPTFNGDLPSLLLVAAVIPAAALYAGSLLSKRKPMPARVRTACCAAMLVLGLACTAGAMAQNPSWGTELQEGPCAGLDVSASQESTYGETLELLAKVEDDALYVLGNAQWVLLGAAGGWAPLGDAEWVLAVAGSDTNAFESEYGELYLPFSSNSSATLYKRVSEQSFIAAG